MQNFKNSVAAFVIVTVSVLTVSIVAAILWPDIALECVKNGTGNATSFVYLGLVGWGVWLFHERRLYEGWQVEVIDKKGTAAIVPVPAPVVKQWIAAKFGDWGPNGWRDITGTLVRRPNCGPVNVDAAKAEELGVLHVIYRRKIVRVDYTKLPPDTPRV